MKIKYSLRLTVRENGEIKEIVYPCASEREADLIQYGELFRLADTGGKLLDAKVALERSR